MQRHGELHKRLRTMYPFGGLGAAFRSCNLRLGRRQLGHAPKRRFARRYGTLDGIGL